MKKILTYPIAFMAILAIASCKKNKTPKGCFTIKYINSVCYTRVYQIQDADYYSYGQDNWKDELTGTTYNHVFVLQNYCDAMPVNTKGITKVFINDCGNTSSCITCQAVYPNSPVKSLNLVVCE